VPIECASTGEKSRISGNVKFAIAPNICVFLSLIRNNACIGQPRYQPHYRPLVISGCRSVNTILGSISPERLIWRC